MSPLPEPFQALEAVLPEANTLDRAKWLGEALRAIPELQKALRADREKTLNDMHHIDGVSYADMAPELELTPIRVASIANGYTRSGNWRAGEPKKDAKKAGRKPAKKPAATKESN